MVSAMVTSAEKHGVQSRNNEHHSAEHAAARIRGASRGEGPSEVRVCVGARVVPYGQLSKLRPGSEYPGKLRSRANMPIVQHVLNMSMVNVRVS